MLMVRPFVADTPAIELANALGIAIESLTFFNPALFL
jgi:hypothetical protein